MTEGRRQRVTIEELRAQSNRIREERRKMNRIQYLDQKSRAGKMTAEETREVEQLLHEECLLLMSTLPDTREWTPGMRQIVTGWAVVRLQIDLWNANEPEVYTGW